MNKSINKMVYAALIAAVYASLTLVLAPISYGPLQVRIAEALTVLPFFSSFSLWGVFIGCLVSNIFSPYGIIDLLIGSSATLIAAVMTYYIGRSSFKYKKLLAPLPPIIVNAIIIGFLISSVVVTNPVPVREALAALFTNPSRFKELMSISLSYSSPIFWTTALWVGLGQCISCYIIGYPLLRMVDKNPQLKKYFKN